MHTSSTCAFAPRVLLLLLLLLHCEILHILILLNCLLRHLLVNLVDRLRVVVLPPWDPIQFLWAKKRQLIKRVNYDFESLRQNAVRPGLI